MKSIYFCIRIPIEAAFVILYKTGIESVCVFQRAEEIFADGPSEVGEESKLEEPFGRFFGFHEGFQFGFLWLACVLGESTIHTWGATAEGVYERLLFLLHGMGFRIAKPVEKRKGELR